MEVVRGRVWIFSEIDQSGQRKGSSDCGIVSSDNKIVHSKSGKDLKHVSRAVIIKKVYLNLLMFSIPISNHVLS